MVQIRTVTHTGICHSISESSKYHGIPFESVSQHGLKSRKRSPILIVKMEHFAFLLRLAYCLHNWCPSLVSHKLC